jgi:hypothetical protein
MYTPFSDTPICSILQQSCRFTSEITLAAGRAAAAGPNVGLPAQIVKKMVVFMGSN